MFSQLHARRKAAAHEGETGTLLLLDAEAGGSAATHNAAAGHHHHHCSTNSSNNETPKRRSHFRKRQLPKEIQWAFSSVTIFLACGLFLGYFLVHHRHRKVIYHVLRDPLGHGRGVLQGRVGFRHHFYSGAPRYVTVVLPSVVKPEGRSRRLDAIQDTWGPSARAIYVVHNVTEFPQAAHAIISEDSKPQDPYAFPQLLLMPETISTEAGLPRLYHTIRTIFEKVNPDFAFFVNDHTFVLAPHVCNYLEDKDPAADLYAGRTLADDKMLFNSGAAGYFLSRATMQKLVEKWDAQDETCWIGSEAKKWLQGNPGLVNAKCLASMNIQAIDTRAKEKWHRFHAFPLTRVVSGDVDDWYRNKHQKVAEKNVYDPSYGTLLSGPDCCSTDTISFHYVEWKEAMALFAVREELLRNPRLSDHELKSLMVTEWPRSLNNVGAYSRPLPKDADERGWKELLITMRKISLRQTQRDC